MRHCIHEVSEHEHCQECVDMDDVLPAAASERAAVLKWLRNCVLWREPSGVTAQIIADIKAGEHLK